MRILILLAGPDSVSDILPLSEEIRAFNAEIDFRLRFLDIQIEDSFAAPQALLDTLAPGPAQARVLALPDDRPLDAAAVLALFLHRERPSLLVIAGEGSLLEVGAAAARATGVRLAFYGAVRGAAEEALDLGSDPKGALERLSGVAREVW